MTMDRENAPGQGREPEFVSNAPDDAREYRTEGWGPIHYIFIALALLMLLAGALWLGTLVGLLAAVLPGGEGPVGGALYGALGIIGVLILLWAINRMRSGRR
jgi:hypothetical protein